MYSVVDSIIHNFAGAITKTFKNFDFLEPVLILTFSKMRANVHNNSVCLYSYILIALFLTIRCYLSLLVIHQST